MQQEMLTSNVLKVTEFVTVNELAIMMNNTPVTKVRSHPSMPVLGGPTWHGLVSLS